MKPFQMTPRSLRHQSSQSAIQCIIYLSLSNRDNSQWTRKYVLQQCHHCFGTHVYEFSACLAYKTCICTWNLLHVMIFFCLLGLPFISFNIKTSKSERLYCNIRYKQIWVTPQSSMKSEYQTQNQSRVFWLTDKQFGFVSTPSYKTNRNHNYLGRNSGI